MPSPPTSRPLKVAFRTLGVVLALGLATWLARDLPRRLVVSALAERLTADVRLERLEVLAADRFVLVGLEVSRIRDLPAVERLVVEELEVEAALGDVRSNRFRRLRLSGVEARLVPAPAVDVPDRPLPRIGELVLEPATVAVATQAGDDPRLIVEATAFDVGGSLRGRARLRSPDLELAPWLAVLAPAATVPAAGRLEALDAALRLGSADRTATVSAARLRLSRGDRVLELTGPRLEAELEGPASFVVAAERADLTLAGETASADAPRLVATVTPPAGEAGPWRFDLRPQLAWLESGTVEGDWHPRERRLGRLDARLEGLDLARLLPGAGLEATADLELHTAGGRLDWSASITPRRLRLDGDRELVAGRGSKLKASGSLPFGPLAALEAPVWDGPITATLALPAARARWDGRRLPPALLPLEARFEGRWQGLEPLRLAGAARLETAGAGRIETAGELQLGTAGARADLTWTWSGARLGRLAALLRDEGPASVPFEIEGDATAAGRLGGDLRRPRLDGELRLDGLEVGRDPWRLRGGEATAAWSWTGDRQPIRLRSLAGRGTLEAPDLRPLPVVLEAAGWSLVDGSRGEVETASLTSPGLGTARLEGRWRVPAGRFEATADLALAGLDLAGWRRALTIPVAGLDGFALGGTAGAELEVALGGDAAWRLEGPVRLAAGGFASEDGSRVMEGLAGSWDVSVRGAPGMPIEAQAEGRAGGFVLLWATFFGDFSSAEAEVELRARTGSASGDTSPPWRLEARVAVPGGPVVQASLEDPAGASAGGLRYALSLEDPDLASTRERYLADLLEDRLGRFELGGRLSVHGRGHLRPGAAGNPAVWNLIGEARIADLRLASGGGQAAVQGLDLELPLDLHRRPTDDDDYSGPRLGGRLAFERLALRGLELPPTESDLRVEADSVGLEKPVALGVLGGTLTLERLTLKHLLRPGRHLETGLELRGLRLERIAEELGLFPLEGTLDGRFPLARLSPERLRVEGGGRIEAFGGAVDVRDISGEDVLTRYPKITLSADFREIDLGRLTRRIDFGEMTGIVEGSLEDCELFRGVPVRFKARLESVERKGVPRTVDVKAVNNLTILGTGQGTGVLDRGIRRFFDRYRYERLGVTLELDHDVLTMRGLERRGDKELFLRGRFPFRIDVVNAQPGRTVSFQAMVRRLKSLDFARAATER